MGFPYASLRYYARNISENLFNKHRFSGIKISYSNDFVLPKQNDANKMLDSASLFYLDSLCGRCCCFGLTSWGKYHRQFDHGGSAVESVVFSKES